MTLSELPPPPSPLKRSRQFHDEMFTQSATDHSLFCVSHQCSHLQIALGNFLNSVVPSFSWPLDLFLSFTLSWNLCFIRPFIPSFFPAFGFFPFSFFFFFLFLSFFLLLLSLLFYFLLFPFRFRIFLSQANDDLR